jgi:DNA topoisomerase I
VDTNFTADMERRLDGVEEGRQGWTEFLKDFYAALRGQLERAETEMDRVQKPVEEANEDCPQCGRPLLIRSGRFGRFISCSGYPECDFKKPLVAKTGAHCPKDGGDLVERRGKRTGKVFYGCANFPTCDFVVWDRPLTTPCPECGGLLTLANGKTEAHCISCGALVTGAQEGTPEVVGHRAPAPERPRRAAGETTARKTTARKTTTARKPATTTRKTTTTRKVTPTRASRATREPAAS